MPSGIVIAAPASGSGKTTVTLALLRLLSREGRSAAAFKTGPDYIDGAFHRTACGGRPCYNLDAFAMRPETVAATLATGIAEAELAVIEGAMGLFDGAADGSGSTADLAGRLGLPVILVIDAARQSQSVAALVHGFRSFRPEVTVSCVILNRVASPRHEALLRAALRQIDMPLLAALPAQDDLQLPSRHLGLVQAEETGHLDLFLDSAADWLHRHLDRAGFEQALAPLPAMVPATGLRPLPPLGQRIAVARDAAFAFSYAHLLQGWREQGASLSFFSPLHDDAPDATADAIFLPGGYPELHAARLAGNRVLMQGLRTAAARQAAIYGECGGFMLLGRSLTDAEGHSHAMAGLLPVATSFATRQRQLGYRRITALADTPLGPAGSRFRGHEFHYSVQNSENGTTAPLFAATDAAGTALGALGCRQGSVFGSYLHLIDRE